jgi:hypothetical protein
VEEKGLQPTISTVPMETPTPAHIGTVTQSPDDCTLYAVDGPVPAGPVTLTATNNTDDAVSFHLVMIADGHTYDEVATHVVQEKQLAKDGKPGLGFPTSAIFINEINFAAGRSGTATFRVGSGTYTIVCLRMFETVNDLRPFDLVGPIEVR